MLAALVEQSGPIASKPLRLLSVPDIQAGPGELLIRVQACAVCRTDLQIAEGDLPVSHLPLIPGHQAVGEVVALGDGVRDWAIGDRAGVGWLGSACEACRHCLAGRENLCEQAVFTGWQRQGGFAGLITVRSAFALRLPVTLQPEAVAPLLCGGIIGYRSLTISGVPDGGRLGLYGFGASARLALQVAVHRYCEVFVVTRSERDRQAALRLGAAWAGDPGERPPARLDGAITFAPVGSVVIEALKAVDRGGTVAINAIHLDGIPAFDYDDLWLERRLQSVANYTRDDARDFLQLAATIPVVTEFEIHPLAAANEALERVSTGAVHGAAVLSISS